MSHPVFSHLIGTMALISAMIIVSLFVEGILYVAFIQTQEARLAEVAEAVAREIVEIVSVHTLGEGGFTYMDLTIPQLLGEAAYKIELQESGENRLVVKVSMQHHQVVKVVVVPNFGTGAVRVANQTIIDNSRNLEYGPTLLVPCKKPKVIVYRVGNNYYIALGRELGD